VSEGDEDPQSQIWLPAQGQAAIQSSSSQYDVVYGQTHESVADTGSAFGQPYSTAEARGYNQAYKSYDDPQIVRDSTSLESDDLHSSTWKADEPACHGVEMAYERLGYAQTSGVVAEMGSAFGHLDLNAEEPVHDTDKREACHVEYRKEHEKRREDKEARRRRREERERLRGN